jgi:hypothetical protein
MPADKSLWPDDYHGFEDRWAPTIKLNEKQAIAVRELDATEQLALQYNQLVPERSILCFKSALWLEDRGTQVEEEEYQRGRRNPMPDAEKDRQVPAVLP